MNKTCKTCEHACSVDVNSSESECLANPPKVFQEIKKVYRGNLPYEPRYRYVTKYPTVWKNRIACGEWKEAEGE